MFQLKILAFCIVSPVQFILLFSFIHTSLLEVTLERGEIVLFQYFFIKIHAVLSRDLAILARNGRTTAQDALLAKRVLCELGLLSGYFFTLFSQHWQCQT